MGRIAIVGVGAIGGVTAAFLETTSQHKLTLCTRRPLRELIVRTGEGLITVKAENLTDPGAAGPGNTTNPATAEPMDWVLVSKKVYDAKTAAAWLPRLCGPHTPVAILQNGVEHRENFQIGRAHV